MPPQSRRCWDHFSEESTAVTTSSTMHSGTPSAFERPFAGTDTFRARLLSRVDEAATHRSMHRRHTSHLRAAALHPQVGEFRADLLKAACLALYGPRLGSVVVRR